MGISAWKIYLVCQLDIILVVLVIFGCVFGIISLISYMMATEAEENEAPALRKRGLRSLLVMFLFFLLLAFTPSSQTAAAMYILPKISKSETINKEASELYQLTKEVFRRLVE